MKHGTGKECVPEELVLYHYGELEEAARRRVADHLAGCPGCREELWELERTLAAVPRPAQELSAAEVRRFAGRVAAAAGRRRSPLRPLWGGALAALAALIITIAAIGPDAVSPPGGTERQLKAEMEVLEAMEFLQDMELLEDLDLLQEMGKWG